MQNSQNQSILNYDEINNVLLNHFDLINRYFDLGLREDGTYWKGCCPLHTESDNSSAFVVFPNASFFCYTRCPHRGHYSLLNLLKLLLHKKFNDYFNNEDAICWFANNIAQVDFSSLPKPTYKTKTTYVPQVLYKNINEWHCFAGEYSAEYAKKFPVELIKKLHIGECHDRTSRMFNRIVVPQIDRMGRIIGITGRSLYPVCSRCKGYHSPKSPCITSGPGAKWLHCHGFKTGHHLYLDWLQPKGLQSVQLVESVGNALRAYENGYGNTLGQFGSTLKDGQADILRYLNVRYINIIIDNDSNEAGLIGARKTIEKYGPNGTNDFIFKIIKPLTKDIEILTGQQLTDLMRENGIRKTH